jgi:hypothetical protein
MIERERVKFYPTNMTTATTAMLRKQQFKLVAVSLNVIARALQLFSLQRQFVLQIFLVAHLLDLQVFSRAFLCFFLEDVDLSVEKV